MEGKDVALAAETGSGKTLAYLLPILQRILERRQEDASTEQNTSIPLSQKMALVLCPSVDLCQQVQSVIFDLCGTNGSLVRSEISPAGLSRYLQRPDILLGTPGSFLTTITEMQSKATNAIINSVGICVMDEADLMLVGSYRTQIDRLLQVRFPELRFQNACLPDVV